MEDHSLLQVGSIFVQHALRTQVVGYGFLVLVADSRYMLFKLGVRPGGHCPARTDTVLGSPGQYVYRGPPAHEGLGIQPGMQIAGCIHPGKHAHVQIGCFGPQPRQPAAAILAGRPLGGTSGQPDVPGNVFDPARRAHKNCSAGSDCRIASCRRNRRGRGLLPAFGVPVHVRGIPLVRQQTFFQFRHVVQGLRRFVPYRLQQRGSLLWRQSLQSGFQRRRIQIPGLVVGFVGQMYGLVYGTLVLPVLGLYNLVLYPEQCCLGGALE